MLAYTRYKNKVLSILFTFPKLTKRELKLIQTLRERKEIQGYIIDKTKYLKVFIFEGYTDVSQFKTVISLQFV